MRTPSSCCPLTSDAFRERLRWGKYSTSLSRWRVELSFKKAEYEVVKADFLAFKTNLDGLSRSLELSEEREALSSRKKSGVVKEIRNMTSD